MTMRELVHLDRPFNIPVLRRSNFGRSLSPLQNEMNRLFDNFFGETNTPSWTAEGNFPAIDIVENDKDFKIMAELPGMDPDNIEVALSNSFLTIRGEKEEQEEENSENYLCHEMSYGAFQRTITLPDASNADKAEATFKNGILTVEVPKKAEALQRLKKLRVKKAA